MQKQDVSSPSSQQVAPRKKSTSGNKTPWDIDGDGQLDAIELLCQKYDYDGSGDFSVKEVKCIVQDLKEQEKANKNLKGLLCAVIFGAVAVCGTLLGLMFAANEVSKESHVKGAQMTSLDGTLVETAVPTSYASMLDLPKLPLKALDALEVFTFTTVDEKLHSYKKSGVMLPNDNSEQLTVHFSVAGVSLFIDAKAKEATLQVNDFNGNIVSSGVVIPKAAGAAKRRLLASGAVDPRRCTNGVCLHTFEEMMYIHGIHGAAHRALATQAGVSYAEVMKDGAAAMNGETAAKKANEVLSNALKGINSTIANNQRYMLTFDYLDLCENYGLDKCSMQAPDESEFEALPFNESRGSPYIGMVPRQGRWYFEDTIVYEKDMESMKVCITYGHDQLKAARAHCVLQKRDGSSFLQFDEITLADGSGNMVVNNVLCTAKAPEGTSAVATSEAEGKGAALKEGNTTIPDDVRRRRMLMSLLTTHEHKFHDIVRSKLAGFGHVLIDMKHIGRHLTEDEPNDEGFKAETESNIEVTTSTNPSTKAMIKADNATHMDDITGVARGTTASTGQCENGCSVTGEARKDDTDTPASAPSDSEDAKSLYSSVEVEVLNGTISWPAASECTAVAGYDNAIPPRKNIDLDMTNAEDPAVTETTPSRRQLHEMDMIERSLVNLDERVAEALGEKTRKLRKFTTKRNNKVRDFWNQVKNRASSKGKEIAEEKIEKWLAEWGISVPSINPPTDPRVVFMMNRNVFTVSPNPGSWQCRWAKNEVVRLVNHYDYYINGPLNKIDTYGNKVLDFIADVKQAHEDLDMVSTVLLLIRVPIAGMSFLPYVGPVFRVFGNVLSRLQQLLDRCKKVADKIVKLIDRSKIEPNLEKIVEKAGEIQIILNVATYTTERFVLASLLIASHVCNIANTPCWHVADKLKKVNDLLDRLKGWINHLANLIMQLHNGLKAMAMLMYNGIWQSVVRFFRGIYNLLKPFIDLLNRRICVRLPIPKIGHKRVCITIWYPCGVRSCRRCARVYCGPRCGGCGWRGCRCWSAYCNVCVWYPCGVNWCHRQGCTWVPYPYVQMTSFCFTIMQIIKGVLNLLSLVMNAFTALIKRLIPRHLMPNLSISIPGFPFSMPRLPSLPLPWDLLNLPSLNLCGFNRNGAHNFNVGHSICGINLPRCPAR